MAGGGGGGGDAGLLAGLTQGLMAGSHTHTPSPTHSFISNVSK